MYDDELVCGKNCTSDEFRCSSDRCIDKSKLCDGTPDCQFSIDEWVPECRSVKDQLERDKEIKCPPEKLPCYTDDPGLFYDDLDYHCVHMYEECFHAHQCRVDGCRFYLGCKEDEFTCYDAPCLNKSLLCDGKWNCIGGVDESPIACLFKIQESFQKSTSGLSTSSVFVYIIVFVLIAAIVWQIYLMCWSSVSPKEKPVELNKIEKPPQAIEQKQSTTKVNKSKSNSTLDVSKSKPKLDIIKSKSSSKLNVVKSKSNPKLDEIKSKSSSKLNVVKSKSNPKLDETRSKSNSKLIVVKSKSSPSSN
ncbi:low-density lipoprotein receptor class A domain-containing protein 3-like isoform X2 [Panonychus citri]|nr:low-density lipoprotein receptor class A domain-containing protein 3-like isoform X2 [Panonychus citri]